MSLAAFTFTDRVRPIVEVGLGDTRTPVGSSTWDVARWDDAGARWSGEDPTWIDITCDVQSAQCQYGRDHATDRFVPGVATIIATNATGWADPNADVTTGVLTMRPGRAIRFGVDHIGFGIRWLFRGFIDRINPTYTPVELTDVVQIDCIDALGEVNRAVLKPYDTPQFAGDTADERIGRILDGAKWSTTKRDLAPTGTTLLGSDLGGQVADLLSQAADSAGGSVYGDLDANVVFRNRDWQMYAPGTPPDGSIGNVDPGRGGYWSAEIPAESGWLDPRLGAGSSSETITGLDGREWTVDQSTAIVRSTPVIPPHWVDPYGDVCPVAWERPFARADMATRVIMGNTDEPPAVVQLEDIAGQTLYGIEPFSQTDLVTERTDVLTVLANRILRTRSATTAPRVRSVTLDARTADNAIDMMTTVDVYKPSRYLCRLLAQRGLVFNAEHFATGVVHELAADSWTLLLSLDLSAPWLATGGRWDQTAFWDRTVWAA